MAIKITQRKRFFIAVEGEGEQSFIKWVGQLAEQNGLHIHLDCQPLSGGGYKTMLQKTIAYNKKKKESRGTPKDTILLVDSDRAARQEDGWTIEVLKKNAKKEKITVCIQHPNQEGFLLRMLKGNESKEIDAKDSLKLLKKLWPEYQKPIDARALAKKYNLKDLLRLAKTDKELQTMLEIIGLYEK